MAQDRPPAELVSALEEARRSFLALVDEIRPDLHRYCSRMMGSTLDGEDVLQETLAQAYYHLPQLNELPPLKPWLLRIAHNKAIDALRREGLRATEPLETAMDIADDDAGGPESDLMRRQAVEAALASFLRLAPAQRACVILKDVLEYSLEDIAEQLGMSVPAVKAALHRAREGLRLAQQAAQPARRTVSEDLQRYARLFNAHDWDGVRQLLADEVRLDLVDRRRFAGPVQVGTYFSNYERAGGWHLVPGLLDGREVLAVCVDGAQRPRYFIALEWQGGRVSRIQDTRYVPYIGHEARFVPHPDRPVRTH